MKKKDIILQEMYKIKNTLNLYFSKRQDTLSHIHNTNDLNENENYFKSTTTSSTSLLSTLISSNENNLLQCKNQRRESKDKASILISIIQLERMFSNILNTFSVNSLIELINKQNSLYSRISKLSFRIMQKNVKYIYLIFQTKICNSSLAPLTIIVKPYPTTEIIKVYPMELSSFILSKDNGNNNNDSHIPIAIESYSFSTILCKMIFYYVNNSDSISRLINNY